jgi:hypothetical protein
MDKYEGPGEIQMNSRTLAEAVSVSVQTRSNSSPVRTMKKGLNGRSRGPIETQIQVSSAVPKSGLEQEYVEKCIDDADVTISVKFGGRTYLYDGWIDETNGQNSVDSPADLSFTVMAGKPRIVG